jgi:hypothetical protein
MQVLQIIGTKDNEMAMNTKHKVMENPYGRYLWYPNTSVVEYIERGRSKPVQIAFLTEAKNTELGAVAASVRHLVVFLRKQSIDKV